MFGFHAPELIIILVVALLIFGPKKLPEMGSAIGKSIKEFQKGMKEITTPKEAPEDEPATPADLNAIERELASKRAAFEKSTPEPTSQGSEASSTEGKAE